MSGKQKRFETVPTGPASGTPLSAVAAARLKAEAVAQSKIIPQPTLESTPKPPIPHPNSSQSTFAERDDPRDVDVSVKRSLKFGNWRNEAPSVLSDTRSGFCISLSKHASIALIGCFEFKVIKGAVNINGANIGPSSHARQEHMAHRAFVPATHPVPKIRGLDGTNHIHFTNCREPETLTGLGPLFTNVWTGTPGAAQNRSFRVVMNSDDDPSLRPLTPEITPESWLQAIEVCTSSPSTTLVTGPSESGKSTFARRLVNRSLTGLGKTARSVSAVCYLDLDPLKQEYAPPGQITLLLVRVTNLGPAFTHPATMPGNAVLDHNETIRAHPVPANLANYGNYYRSCIEDLFLAYKSLYSSDSSIPLIVDTPGFLHTTSFGVLNDLLARIKPHNVVHIGTTQTADEESTEKLHLLRTTVSHHRGTVYEVTATGSLSGSMRTGIEIRAMHMQSYFHLKAHSTMFRKSRSSIWDHGSLSELLPWEFCYQETLERRQDFVGFAMYSEPVEIASLVHALDGSIIQIMQSTSSAIPIPYTSLPRTSEYQIPYIPKSRRTGVVKPLDPRTSKLICTAMLRGFDPDRKVVLVLVPKTHDRLLYGLSPERTVFVGGCCDMPDWAILEGTCIRDKVASHTGSVRSEQVKDTMLRVEEEQDIEKMGYLGISRRVRKFQT